jgi:hypothetical protein
VCARLRNAHHLAQPLEALRDAAWRHGEGAQHLGRCQRQPASARARLAPSRCWQWRRGRYACPARERRRRPGAAGPGRARAAGARVSAASGRAASSSHLFHRVERCVSGVQVDLKDSGGSSCSSSGGRPRTRAPGRHPAFRQRARVGGGAGGEAATAGQLRAAKGGELAAAVAGQAGRRAHLQSHGCQSSAQSVCSSVSEFRAPAAERISHYSCTTQYVRVPARRARRPRSCIT